MRALVALSALALAGCSTLPSPTEPVDPANCQIRITTGNFDAEFDGRLAARSVGDAQTRIITVLNAAACPEQVLDLLEVPHGGSAPPPES